MPSSEVSSCVRWAVSLYFAQDASALETSCSSDNSQCEVLPTVYDEELVYSLAARYGALVGYPDARSANLDLFGVEFCPVAARNPTFLRTMAERLPTSIGVNARDLYLRHTLLPYYNAFNAPAAFELAFEWALDAGRRRGRPAGSAEVLLPKPSNLRFCPDCLQEMLGCGQDLHWKRVHQLAIVAVCPIHGCDLLMSTVAISPNDRTLYPPTTERCSEGSPSVIPIGTFVDRKGLMELSQDAYALLRGQFPERLDQQSGTAYAQLFRDLGYGNRSRMNWKLLGPAVNEVLMTILPALPGLGPQSGSPPFWFVETLRQKQLGHTDRILIASFIVTRIKSIEPRFWTAFNVQNGRPFLTLADAA